MSFAKLYLQVRNERFKLRFFLWEELDSVIEPQDFAKLFKYCRAMEIFCLSLTQNTWTLRFKSLSFEGEKSVKIDATSNLC